MKRLIFLFIVLITCIFPTLKANEIYSSAESCIVMETQSRRIIYQKNINNVYLTASICKILTCITAIEYGQLDSWCIVTQETATQKGSSIYLQLNDKVKLIDLLYGLMLRSGNDAAFLIAQSCGGYDQFIISMNEMAKKIGMHSSTFTNPSGLDDYNQNYSTALDMAKLMAYCSENELFMKINGTKTYVSKTYNGKDLVFINKHKLIQTDSRFVGGKTGYTEKAHRTLVSFAKDNGLELVVVTFNCSNDFNEHRSLVEYALNNYEMKVMMKSQIIESNRNLINYTPCLIEDVRYLVRSNMNEEYRIEIELYYKQNDLDHVGMLYLYLNDETVLKQKIYRYY